MARWNERTRGPNWLMDAAGRLLGYKDASGNAFSLVGGDLNTKAPGDEVNAADLTAADVARVRAGVVLVEASRTLTDADDGATLECSTSLTLTVPEGLVADFGCAVIPSGTTSVARFGAALLNGAGATLTRAAASNAMFAIVGRASAADSYIVTGA